MPDDATPAADIPQARLASIDALRGFDMLWIIGGEVIARDVARRTHSRAGDAVIAQLEHVAWRGFRFYDLIFPLFLFLVGAVLPFSMAKFQRGTWAPYRRIARRAAILFLLGLATRVFFAFDWPNLRVAGVLQRIALCYAVAAVITLKTSWRGQLAFIVAILAGYWLLLANVAPPGGVAGDYSPAGNLAGWVDRHYLPGKIFPAYYGFGDNEGLLSTLPAVATALLGALAGQVLRSRLAPGRKVATLVVAGALGVCGGLAWGQSFPIIKNLWTSSFVLLAGGYSALLLAAFYLVIDVLGYRRWSYFFVVIGANAITIYWLRRFVGFGAIAGYFLGGTIRVSGSYGPLVAACGTLAAEWAMLLVLYRKRIYLRV